MQAMETRKEAPRAQTIVKQVSGNAGVERFCILHEAPLTTANAFMFTCAGGRCGAHGVTIVEACNLLVAAGISEPDVYRLLEEARAGHRADIAQI
jgi:hypothetical protein